MKFGIVLFTSDRGITPAAAARAVEANGFESFFVPEHTHIPVKRTAAHPLTGDASLPDDRYMRTLDPWVSLAMAAAVTERIELATICPAVASRSALDSAGTQTNSQITACLRDDAEPPFASIWKRCTHSGHRTRQVSTASS